MKYTKLKLGIILLSFIFLSSACNKSEEEKGEQPTLPGLKTLLIDYSDFHNKSKSKKVVNLSDKNFTQATTSLGFWYAFNNSALSIPAASYSEALKQQAEYLGNNSWEWNYDIEIDEKEYTITLTATRIDDVEFSVEMQIALKSLTLINFKYLDGKIKYDHSHAEWSFYAKKGIIEPSFKVIEAVWDKNLDTNASSLKYTYVEPDHAETGSYILWALTPDAVYDATYAIDRNEGSTINIEWNTTTKAGRIKSETKFGDTIWHCWNNLYEDIVCPV